MGRAGDDPLVDPFDPGVETGYLRRAPRDRELEPELGAHPFDPGPGRYDDRRARKAAKREQREQGRRERRRQRTEGAAVASAGAQPADGDSVSEQKPPASPQPPDPMALAVGAAPADAPAAPSAAAEIVPLPRRAPSMAERLQRERLERERIERRRRAAIELERAEREHAERERREARRRERAEHLRREREALRRRQPEAPPPARRKPAGPQPPTTRPRPAARRRPGVSGPVRPRRGLLWPTAKAGVAITVVLGLTAALGALLGLPVPGLDAASGNSQLASSADLFGIDPGTPAGLSSGYVFPLIGPHDFGDAEARFGASRYGHTHEGQDIFGKVGTPEVAVHDGVVVDWGTENGKWSGGRGNYIAIYSPADDHSFVYMHMLKPSPVHMGQSVHAGEVIGQLGCTGSCDGPHLHFEVRIGRASLRSDTKPVDPLPYLRQWPQATPG
jgi:murein DD-endopeptidase MepM/ murein hydrolase activator NlpD